MAATSIVKILVNSKLFGSMMSLSVTMEMTKNFMDQIVQTTLCSTQVTKEYYVGI